QYAFIYATARRLNTSFYLDKSIENFLLPQYFEIKNDFIQPLDNRIFSIKGYKNLFQFYLKKAFYAMLRMILFGNNKIIIDNDTSVNAALTRIKNNCLYEGYFHSESYFAAYKKEIKKLYTVRETYKAAFEQLKKQFNPAKKKAVIHVRRKDYIDIAAALPLSYYKKAIDIINSDDMQFIFISDDPAFIEDEFGYVNNKYISTHNEIIDLQFMMNADVCILSCSSFSWWGAWLNTQENKHVFAPQYWLGFKQQVEFPVGIADNLNFNWINV